MKKLIFIITCFTLTVLACAQMPAQQSQDIRIKKSNPRLYFNSNWIGTSGNTGSTLYFNGVAVGAGGVTNWGSIGGVLATQADLQAALNLKSTYPPAGIPVSTGATWAASINNNSDHWNTAYGWGNHSTAGYYSGSSATIRGLFSSSATGLTYTSSTGIFSFTGGYAIPTMYSQNNWNTAYGWGNHAGLYDPAGTANSVIATHNSAYNHNNYNTAYTDRLKWDGGATGLTAATGRTSLGGTTVGQNLFTLTNPGAITFLRINANNTVTALSAANFKTALSLVSSDVGLGNVTNESKATMFNNSALTGTTTAVNISASGGIQQKGIFNVINYGAVGNGITDDFTALQAALTAGIGGIVYFPKGVYITSATLQIGSNTIVMGEGPENTIIRCDTNIVEGRGIITYLHNAKDIRIKDICIDGYKENFLWEKGNHFGINWYNYEGGIGESHANYVTLENVEITRTSSWGISVTSGHDVTFDKVWLHNNADTSSAGGIIFGNTYNIRILNSIIDSSYNQAIYLSTTAHDALIENSTFRYNTDGLDIRADSNIVINGNIIEYNDSQGLFMRINTPSQGYWKTGLRIRNIVATNNIIRNNGGSLSPYCQVLIHGGENILLANNIIQTHVATQTKIGVSVYSNNINVSVLGNEISAPIPIQLNGDTLINIRIIDNKLSRLTEAGAKGIINVGISLLESNIMSRDVTIMGNVIDTCSASYITLYAAWLARYTKIQDNIYQNPSISETVLDLSPVTRTNRSEFYTVKKTIGWDGATGTDFKFVGDAGHVAQNINLGEIVPKKSRIIGIEIVCREAAVGVTDITFRAGNASAGEQFIVSLTCDELYEVVGIITPTLPSAVIMKWTAGTEIYIGADPTDNNWSDMTAGKWDVYVTYINYSQ